MLAVLEFAQMDLLVRLKEQALIGVLNLGGLGVEGLVIQGWVTTCPEREGSTLQGLWGEAHA